MDNLLLKYDCVLINDLVIPMSVGIYDHEKTRQQNVVISVEVYVEKVRVIEDKTIDDVVSYEDIANQIRGLCQSRHFDLVEVLAEKIAQMCLENTLVHLVSIKVLKPDIIKDAGAVGVHILRHKINL